MPGSPANPGDFIDFLHCFEGKIYGEATRKIFTELKTISKIKKDMLLRKKLSISLPYWQGMKDRVLKNQN